MIKTANEQANQLALKQRFVDRAKALSNVAEVFRCQQVTLLICDTVAFGVRAEAEILQAAYGERSGRKYWEAHLSEPMPVYPFALVLSAHEAEKVEHLETGYQLLRLTLERKRLIIRQLVRNAGKISWENARAAGRHQPL